MLMSDTIFAISSPPSPGGARGILRLSGPAAHALVRALSDLPLAAVRGCFPMNLDLSPGQSPGAPVSLACFALLFAAPRSFTGQDCAELHLPNSPALLAHLQERLLAAARTLQLAARPAEPGEFSARAFFNGKIDLTEAEGIAATINATNQTQLRAAASLRSGDLHKEMDRLADQLANLLALIEAAIDFTDEEGVEFIGPAQLRQQLGALGRELHDLLAHAVRADRLDALPTVVFIGRPNVGKSSLINALARTDRSITSPIAGTTRDRLSITLHTGAGPVRLVDVPGEETAVDELRTKMMATRELALLEADLIVEVVTHPADLAAAGAGTEERSRFPASKITVLNKSDLLPAATGSSPSPTAAEAKAPAQADWQKVSALTGSNIDRLREEISRQVATRTASTIAAQIPALNQRHRAILHEVQLLLRAIEGSTGEEMIRRPELLAAELRRALDLLGGITGAISPDEIIGRIFSRFCIGK
jgi:tRNA modification GTPase